MLDQFIYENHLGQRFDGLANGVYLNTSELRNYTWSYQTINSRISRFYRKTTNRKIPLFVVGQTDAQAIEAMNRLLDITEADVALHVPGKIFVGEYYTTGFVTVSKKTECLQSKQLCKIEMTLTSDDPAWYRDEVHSFYTDASTPKAAKSGDVITVSNVPASPVRGFTLYGKTTQNGTPSPDAPVALQTVGADGNVVVSTKAGVVEGGNEHITIITQPRGVSTPQNTDIVFSVVAEGEGLSYQWEYSTDGGKNWANSAINDTSKTSVLAFTARAYHNGYPYRCLITDKNGNKLRTNEVVLTIAGDTTVYDDPVTVQTATITTPNGLPGVPVTSGGNYTDANGQPWIADTIEYNADAGTAKYVQRVRVVRLTSTSHNWSKSAAVAGRYLFSSTFKAGVRPMCTAFAGVDSGTVAGTVYNNQGMQMCFNTSFATIDEWKAYLNANENYLAYALATPVETDLTTSEFYALRMQSPNTTLYNEDGAFMDVVYSTVANTSGSAVGGFDYPYEYNLEYGVQIGGRSIANSSYTGNAFRIVIYGAVINPTIIIGGHPYTVNGAVGEGETLTIDSMTKTITLTTASGSKINYFDKRDRQNYIFQPIQPGQNAVAWSGDFGFELTVIEERSEPKWT